MLHNLYTHKFFNTIMWVYLFMHHIQFFKIKNNFKNIGVDSSVTTLTTIILTKQVFMPEVRAIIILQWKVKFIRIVFRGHSKLLDK